jgi:predicted permease
VPVIFLNWVRFVLGPADLVLQTDCPAPRTSCMPFELRQAIRNLLRNPGFTILCAATLALGIGAATAVFTVVNAVLLEPLRFSNPERIVTVATAIPGRPAPNPRMTGGDYVDLRDSNHAFDAISVYFGGEMGVQFLGRAEFTGVWMVNEAFFKVFGQSVRTSAGSAVVSSSFATRNFGDPRSARGRQIQVENRAYTIAGVLEGARFPEKADIWLPAPETPTNLNRTAYNYRVVARLKPDVPLTRAQADLTAIAARVSEGKKNFVAIPLRDQMTGPIRQTLYLLLGAVGLVLLIACANVSNLLLARATVRTREIAVRAALGASRTRIIRQLVLESGLLGILGGAGGLGLAWIGARALLRLAPPNLPRTSEIGLNLPVLAFALTVSLLSALFFGVAPAFRASRAEFGARGVLKGGSHGLRNSLVIAEVALAFVLATGAGLLFRSFLALNETDMGFKTERTLVVYAHAPARTLKDYVGVGEGIGGRLLPSISAIPGVTSTGAAMGLPTGQYGSDGLYAVLGKHTWGRGQKLPQANFSLASPNYFATLGVPLLRGRDFASTDSFNTPGAVIVSASLVRQIFGSEDPIGHQIVCGLDEVTMRPNTIVGVVGDVRQGSPGTPPEPTLYFPLEQHPYRANEVQLVVKSAASPGSVAEAVRRAAHDFNPDMALKFTTLDDMVSESISAPRFRTVLSSVFGGLALLLAIAGIYGVMSYMVSQRTGELGLRMALGAAPSNVVALVMSRAGILAAIGLGAGILLSVAASRLIEAMLFGIQPTDKTTYGLAVAGVLAVIALAAAIPAWRAARIDPMVALREDN